MLTVFRCILRMVPYVCNAGNGQVLQALQGLPIMNVVYQQHSLPAEMVSFQVMVALCLILLQITRNGEKETKDRFINISNVRKCPDAQREDSSKRDEAFQRVKEKKYYIMLRN